jgi:DNA invertase Pin-like site-specific DNA recombinase
MQTAALGHQEGRAQDGPAEGGQEAVKAALYARVSTKDKGQDVENQLAQLRRYAAGQEWETVEFIDHESGKRASRAEFQRMLECASRREFKVVLVWALDRFTREGVAETFIHIKRLLSFGVQFESYTEAHFRTTGPAGELMLAIAAWIAKQESIRISERTKAGLATRRAKGFALGRRWKDFPRGQADADRKAGMSWSELERKYKVGQSTIRSGLKELARIDAARLARIALHQAPSKRRPKRSKP